MGSKEKDLAARVLTLDEWPLVEETYTRESGNAMPISPQQSTFHAVVDGARLAAFMHVEMLFHLNFFYVFPEYRRSRVPVLLMRAVDAQLSQLPGFSAIAIPEAASHIKMYERFGGRSLGTREIWRKDF